MRLFRNWVINTFGFSKSEANGAIVLILLVIVTAVLPRIIFNHHENSGFNAKDSLIFITWVSEVEEAILVDEEQDDPLFSKEQPISLQPFDPNIASFQDLISLGFTSKTSGNIVSYVKAGGSFTTKSDLKKIYGISEDQLKMVWDYIQLPTSVDISTESPPLPVSLPVKEELHLIEINSCIAEDLEKIRGIGQVLSTRIIKYRDLLGGFNSPDQLSEVYGLSPEAMNNLKDQILVAGSLQKININSDSLRLITNHPYIDYKLGKAIYNYRKVHGAYQEISDLKRIKVLNDSLFDKISPYISITSE